MQTAAIVSQEIGHEEKLVLDDALRPEATLEKFKALLNRYKDKAAIMVVGHDPSMTDFVNGVLSSGSPLAVDRNEKGRRRQSGERAAQACRAEMVHASQSRAEDSAKLGEEVASEDGLEVSPLLFDRPELQFNTFRRSRHEAESHRSVLMNADVQLTHCAAASLVEARASRSSATALGTSGLVSAGNHLQDRVAGGGQRISHISRNGRDNSPLRRRVSEEFGLGNDVVGVATASGTIDVCPTSCSMAAASSQSAYCGGRRCTDCKRRKSCMVRSRIR